jgi:hypothetical protein
MKPADRRSILRGVVGVFGDNDVYEAHPPADACILMRPCIEGEPDRRRR